MVRCGLILVPVFLWAHLALGAPEFIPIQARAQGRSLTGAHLMNDSLYINPASSSFTQLYAVDGVLLFPKTFALSVLDTKTSSMGGALGYFRKFLPHSEEPLQGVKIGLSQRLSSLFGVGVAAKMVWGPSTEPGHEIRKIKDLDAGLLANLEPIQLGLTGRNLFGGSQDLDLIQEWSLGGRINYKQVLFLSASATSTSKLTPYEYGVGAEFISPYYFSLKGGYRLLTETGSSYWSVGGSLLTPNLSIHYALEMPVREGDVQEHIVGATVYL